MYALWEDFFDDPMEDEVWDAIIGDRWPLEARQVVLVLGTSGARAGKQSRQQLYNRLLTGEPGRWDALIYAGAHRTSGRQVVPGWRVIHDR